LGTLTLKAERQSARMSKITNDGLTRPGRHRMLYCALLRAERQSARMSKITNDGLTRSVRHRMLYSCTHMATVGVKGLTLIVVSLSEWADS